MAQHTRRPPALVRYLFIRMFAAVGLAWNVKIPGPEKIARRLREPSLDVADLDLARR